MKKMDSWIVLILCAALLTGNVRASLSPRILNGTGAYIQDFPYQASFRKDDSHTCGGTIISERHIVTAGHCIHDYMVPPYDGYTFVTGATFKYEGGHYHDIEKITVHPNFSTDGNRGINDIAIITLKDNIVFDEYQQKINLPEHDYQVGQKVNLTGWGRTQQIPPIRPDQLQKLEVELISNEECQEGVIDPENMKIYDTEVCTNNEKGKGMCMGDSGGPLAANGELIGVVSWTDGDYCGGGHPDVYTNVYKFREFIKSVINDTA